MSKWTLFSNHGHVLVVLSRDPDARLRDVAQIVGITERAVQKIVRDLQDGGLVSVTKLGRRNRYHLRLNQPLRHTLEAHCTIGELLEMVNRHAPGLEPEEESPAAEAKAELPETPTVKVIPASVTEPVEAPSEAAGSEEEPIPVAKNVAEDSSSDGETSKTPTPRRRKISPVDDGEQGSLF